MVILFRRFSYKIWKSLKDSAEVRAKYLRDLFVSTSGNFSPKLYLDIGAGLGYNSLVFGESAEQVVALDLHFPKDNVLKSSEKACMIVADACFLPFNNSVFDAVSLFSTIEHIPNQKRALREAIRVLKPGGYLVMQFPNKFFPIELHSCLPFVFLIPLRLRGVIFKRFGHEGLGKINIPSVKKLKKMILQVAPESKIRVAKVMYPSVVVWSKLRFFYKIALKIGLFKAMPLGYLMMLRKM
jgi:ubiquinone/menaquinone biosynthesis C-methylase UbiE